MLINNKKFHLLIILVITSLVYINILQNDFIWDDNAFILSWDSIKDVGNIDKFFQGDVPKGHEGVYRPLRSVFYAVSYKLFGLNPAGYHIQSILIHLACTILIYFISLELVKKRVAAFMASLLFGVLPVHTSAITFITSSFDQIGIIFFLASFYLYIESRYKMSLLFALLAFFSYEMTLTLPLIIVLYSCVKKRNKLKINALYFLAAFFYLIVRFLIIGITTRGSYLGGSFYLTMLAMSKVLIREIMLIIFPFNLSAIHIIPRNIGALTTIDINKKAIMAQSIFNLDIIVSIAAIVFLFLVMIQLFKKQPLYSFCIGWFFIALLPVSNIIPLQSLLDEDWLYLPSFAFCLILGMFVYFLFKKYYNKKLIRYLVIVFFILLVSFYSSATISRNKDWENLQTLWTKTVEQSPTSAIAHNNLGIAYHGSDINKAIQEYQIALTLNPEYAEAHYNLGYAYHGLGELDLAISEYQKTIKYNPVYAKAYNNLGMIYSNQGKFQLAIDNYKTAILLDPTHYKAYYNLGLAYHKLGQIELAIKQYEKALEINPEYENAQNALAIANN